MIFALIFPIALPFVTAATCLALWNRAIVQHSVSLLGSAAHLVACGFLMMNVLDSVSLFIRWAIGRHLSEYHWSPTT
jgi:hypothetical protein